MSPAEPSRRRVVIAGGTGFIGRALCRALVARGDSVAVLSRSAERSVPDAEVVVWSPGSDGEWTRVLEGADAVVNLAGASIAGRRWSDAYKRELRDSRLVPTHALVDAMRRTSSGPRLLVSGSGVNYYGAHGDEELTEDTPPGGDFLARLCVDWEAAARGAEAHGVRVVRLRTSPVFARHGGSLPVMARPFKLFAGGPIAGGAQWMSWIHLDDEVGLLLHALDRDTVRGPVNATAPGSVRNRDFSAALGRALHRPSWAPVPRLALRAAVGEIAYLIATGQRVRPAAALATGYVFRYPTLEAALKAIYPPRAAVPVPS